MPAILKIRVNEKLYLRDPEETKLGRKMVSEGILLLDEIGFDSFTFKKLAERIESTEASIYRYFSSKHQFLQYLVAWYWSWLEYLIRYRTMNIKNAERELEIAIIGLTESDQDDPSSTHIDEALLHRIIVAESARVYLTKQSRAPKGIFESYDQLCELLANIISGIDAKYKWPKALAITLIASAHQQIFYAENFPVGKSSKSRKKDREDITRFLKHLVLSSLNK